MPVKSNTQVHAELGELHTQLLDYKSKRPGSTKSSITIDALKLLFASSDVDPKKDEALKRVIDTYFRLPAGIPYKSFYIFLYMLSERCPNLNVAWFWGEVVYSGDEKLTNRQFFLILKSALKASVKNAK